jgi:hypothetical protein
VCWGHHGCHLRRGKVRVSDSGYGEMIAAQDVEMASVALMRAVAEVFSNDVVRVVFPVMMNADVFP